MTRRKRAIGEAKAINSSSGAKIYACIQTTRGGAIEETEKMRMIALLLHVCVPCGVLVLMQHYCLCDVAIVRYVFVVKEVSSQGSVPFRVMLIAS